jgi:spermidine/putrescine transport system substrate-binding protein
MSQQKRPLLAPEEAAIVRLLSGGRLSRRSMLSGAGALGMGIFASACGISDSTGDSTSVKPTAVADRSRTEKVVKWASWRDYLDIDPTTESYPTLVMFEKLTGIKASYAVDIENNSTYYAEVQSSLHQGRDIQRDIITLTDWTVDLLIREGLVQNLDKSQIPNAKNMLPMLVGVDFDPGRNYSLTWQSGFTGIGYNAAECDKLDITPPKTVDDLWQPQLKNRVMVLSEMRDTIGVIMLQQGKSPESFSRDDFADALSVLEKQLNVGQIRQVVGNSHLEAMKNGEALAVICWSGDVAQANRDMRARDSSLAENPFTFVIPEGGGLFWSDNLVIPIGSPHKQNAELLMNYYYDPRVAAKVAAWVNYVTPVQGAQEEMAKLPHVDRSLVESPMIFPDTDFLKQVHMVRPLTKAEETDFSVGFRKVLGL